MKNIISNKANNENESKSVEVQQGPTPSRAHNDSVPRPQTKALARARPGQSRGAPIFNQCNAPTEGLSQPMKSTRAYLCVYEGGP